MCGIAGIVGRQAPEVGPALARMQAALTHRGPDDRGLWQSPSNLAAFGHTRLAVIDPTPAGHQPMSTPDGRYTISFSGEIYNFRELRRELAARGAAFRTQSDTEVILHGYQAYGSDVVPRLRGMFAFAIWDEHERACLLARDPFGLKPLYFHLGADGALVFASELRAILASRLVPPELDPDGVHGYLRTGTVPEPRTLVKGVSALDAGHLAEWRDGRWSPRRFWTLRFPPESGANHHAESVRAALLDSVRHHFVSDVPVGIFLSGGVDSAAMLALARHGGHDGVRTISMALPGSPADEGGLARRTAERFTSNHVECAIDARQARELFPRYLASIDQPSIDGFNTFVVSKFAREQGWKVALSGVGADELFGGYGSFTRVPRMAAWNEQLAWAGQLRPFGGRLLERFASGPRWRRVGDLLQQAPSVANTYTTFRGIFTRRESRQIAESMGLPGGSDAVTMPAEPADPTVADEVSRLELTRYVRNQLARDSDAASMACGLELRAPFLDVTLFEAVARVPAAIRLASAKQLLRAAVPELPAWVSGPKQCFQFPFADWMDGEWRPVFTDIDARSPVATGTWYRKWCLLVLHDWIERMKRHGG
jgi:asparagine synthase (glutamine-hydrolysing)